MTEILRSTCLTIYVFGILFSCMMSCSSATASTPSSTLTLYMDKPGAIINRNIYGHFSEHLGHCIYGGYWVGEDGPIPNTNGIRNDVVEALKTIKVPAPEIGCSVGDTVAKE